MYLIIWAFHPKPGRELEFERTYGPQGEWAGLFGQVRGYKGTDLLRASDGSGRYLTIDRWESPAAHAAFRETWQNEYETLDRACDELTTGEECIGNFETVDAANKG